MEVRGRKRISDWKLACGTTMVVSHKTSPTVCKRPRTLNMSHDELLVLARQTKKNIEDALVELKNELARMAGRVVDSDHAIILENIQVPTLFPEPSSSSSTCSSSEDS